MNNMEKYTELCDELETKLVTECLNKEKRNEYCKLLRTFYFDCVVYRDKKIKSDRENKTKFA